MKILHILWDLGQGGAQTYVLELVRQLKRADLLISQVLAVSCGGQIAEEIKMLGVRVDILGLKNGYDLAGVFRMHKYLQTSRLSIIHSHSHNYALNFILRKIKVPKVFTEHGGLLLGGRFKNSLAYRIFGRNYQKYIAISAEMARVMECKNKSIADKICVVYNGTDIKQIDGTEAIKSEMLPDELKNCRHKVGIIGRLVPQKGIDTFLETAAIIASKRSDVSFPIVGDGLLRSELKAKAAHLGIEKRVSFLGYRCDARKILKTFDVFLFTSNYEPFGLVLIEAMAARVPVVALKLRGAVGEIVEEGVDGFVVDRKDPALLANRVMTLLDDARVRESFIENARKKVERHFTIESNAKKVLKIYMDCLS